MKGKNLKEGIDEYMEEKGKKVGEEKVEVVYREVKKEEKEK